MQSISRSQQTKSLCHHCGDECNMKDAPILHNTLQFCCQGCLLVYSVLTTNGMYSYYALNENPGTKSKKSTLADYSFLLSDSIANQLIDFKDGQHSSIILKLPQIHCTSCIWLLENLFKLNEGVKSTKVNFVRREARIVFEHEKISLKELAELLASIGYSPEFSLESLDKSHKTKYDKKLLYKLGLAGFSFGNIMLLSFPEYLGFDNGSRLFFLGYINILLAIPVLFYSGFDYIRSAFYSIKTKRLNLDVPIALGMIVLFGKSVFEILIGGGEGYLDSFTGFVFFLLTGKWFQSYTYEALDFDRKYSSYFPISASVLVNNEWISKSLQELKKNEHLLIKNEEIIPCDSVLVKGRGRIDYSFVTGESTLTTKMKGDKILGGGRHVGDPIQVRVLETVDQSYLTQLWKEKVFTDNKASNVKNLIQKISTYFIYVILLIASISFAYWLVRDSSKAFEVFTAVLIVACPCALALSIPFTYGNMIRLLSKKGLYLRNAETIEQIQDINHFVFDKTGTLTNPEEMLITYDGKALSENTKSIIKSACALSHHPLSQAISQFFSASFLLPVDEYRDHLGQGFTAKIENKKIKVGSSDFVFGTNQDRKNGVFVEINGSYIGHFSFRHQLRKGVRKLFLSFRNLFKVHILSGDLPSESIHYEQIVQSKDQLVFGQTPKEKLQFIKSAQEKGDKVMMIGDGLNDAGALKQAEVGIAFTDKCTNFSPSCDGIFIAKNTDKFEEIINYIRKSRYIIYGAFTLAFLYNIIGLFFAITGHLRPVIAAILMPLSSITIIIYGIAASYLLFHFTTRTHNDDT